MSICEKKRTMKSSLEKSVERTASPFILSRIFNYSRKVRNSLWFLQIPALRRSIYSIIMAR